MPHGIGTAVYHLAIPDPLVAEYLADGERNEDQLGLSALLAFIASLELDRTQLRYWISIWRGCAFRTFFRMSVSTPSRRVAPICC